MNFLRQANIQTHTITVRPRYTETDQGGAVHHSVYPVWFEMGRTELLRANNIAYKDLEEAGIFFVVLRLSVHYKRPARYDEELQLTTTCNSVGNARVEHSYRLVRASNGLVLAEGSSVLACIDSKGKPRRIPDVVPPL
jgi:acyl-CoA thioester hydrolase